MIKNFFHQNFIENSTLKIVLIAGTKFLRPSNDLFRWDENFRPNLPAKKSTARSSESTNQKRRKFRDFEKNPRRRRRNASRTLETQKNLWEQKQPYFRNTKNFRGIKTAVL